MNADPDPVLQSAEWMAHRYDRMGDAIQFRQVPRARHAEIPFLTDEYLEGAPMERRARQAAVAAAQPGSLHFLFHSAFCASTMLVRALDLPGKAMGLSEPVLLNDIVGVRRRREADNAGIAQLTGEALRLLARPFSPGETIVVKPSNIFNPLAALALALRPESKAILLYAPLEPFLLSVARKGLWCRLWARELMAGFFRDGVTDIGFDADDYFLQTDLQIAASGWLIQQRIFTDLAMRYPDRIVTLDSETLTSDVEALLPVIAAVYGLDTGGIDWSRTSAIGRNSKTGDPFSPGERQADQLNALAAHRDEIDKVTQWATTVAEQQQIGLNLPLPITAE